MSIHKDPSGRRWVAVEVEVPGALEEVWQAIATGPGVSSWFVHTEVREDGSIVSHFGPGMDAVATRTAWDPPHRFAGEGEMGPGAPKMATEWIVEARAGGKCLVRVIHSLFASTDDWDSQLEGLESGWPDYFRILRLYLTHFRGQPCAPFQMIAMTPEPVTSAWEKLTAPLGLAGAAEGDRLSAEPITPPFAGVVEHGAGVGHPHHFLVRLDQPAPGIAHLFAMPMGALAVLAFRVYLYGPHAAAIAARDEPRWQEWMNTRFVPSTTAKEIPEKA